MRGKLFIGTSGWSYSGWKDTFYPSGMPSGDWLSFYATRFSCVEVNSTFYHLPRASSVRRWVDSTPDGFLFCFKAWKTVTHAQRLNDAADSVRKVVEVLAPARYKAGPLLVQLPPSLKIDVALLDDFLSVMGKVAEGWAVAMEMRHASWYTPETIKTLNKHAAGLVVHDMPRSRCDEPNDGSGFIYMRYHGPTGDYGGSYGDEKLKEDAGRIKGWLDAGRDVYAFFNNDKDGFAIANTERLRAFVGE